MEFEAYPSSPSSGRKDVRLLLKVKNILHSGDSILLPASLLTAGAIMVAYQHLWEGDTGRHSTRNFLAKILVSMLPLAILEKKILTCPDPVGLFAKFSAKVLIMHTLFLGLRVGSVVVDDMTLGNKYSTWIAFIAACGMLPTVFGLRPNFASFVDHLEVLGLALVALCLAFAEVMLLGRFRFKHFWTGRRSLILEDFICTGSDYIEILAFVPAVWIAYRKDAHITSTGQAGIADSQTRALCLFAFMTFFYVFEDIVNAYEAMKHAPLASAGHLGHFLLLLDFGTFILAQLYDPEKHAKYRGSLLNWVADVCGV